MLAFSHLVGPSIGWCFLEPSGLLRHVGSPGSWAEGWIPSNNLSLLYAGCVLGWTYRQGIRVLVFNLCDPEVRQVSRWLVELGIISWICVSLEFGVILRIAGIVRRSEAGALYIWQPGFLISLGKYEQMLVFQNQQLSHLLVQQLLCSWF